jgi:hypothetical protein
MVEGRNISILSVRSLVSSAICGSNAVERPRCCVTSMDKRLRVSIAQFDVPVRKLLFKPQACTQRFHKHAVFGCCNSVDFNDVTFTNKVIGEFGLHEALPSFARSRSIQTSNQARWRTIRSLGKFRYNVTIGAPSKRNSKLMLSKLLALIEPIICKEFVRTLTIWRIDDA